MRAALRIGAVLAGVCGLLGCQGGGRTQSTALSQAQQAYERRDYAGAVARTTRILEAGPNAPEAGAALYLRALAEVGRGRRGPARTDLVRAIDVGRDPDVRWRAFTLLGTLDFEDGQWAAAARSYTVAIERAPRGTAVDMLLLRLAMCYERSGRWTESRQTLQRLVNAYRSGEAVTAARRRLELQPDHFAIQCGVFGTRPNADRLAQRLQQDGLAAYVRDESRGGSVRHVVLVGRLARYEDALRELARVKGYVPDAVLWP